MFKKKYYGLFITLLFMLFLGLFSTSYAAEPQLWDWEDLVDFATQVTTNQPSSLNSGFLNALNRFTSNPNSYKDAITNAGILTQNYHNFLIYNNNNNLWFYMFNYTDNSTVMFRSSDVWFYNVNGYSILVKDNLTTANKQQYTNQAMYVSGTSMIPITIGLQSKTVSDYYGWFFEQNFNYFTSQFIPYHDAVVTFSSHTNVNALKYSYSVMQWALGSTDGFSSLDSFRMFLYDEFDENIVGAVSGDQALNVINNGGATFFIQPKLYVRSSYIRYNRLYSLHIVKTLEGVDTREDYYFVFLPRNAVITNGIITSSGSGDFTTQDATNAIIDEISNTANLSGDLASISSGEIYEKLGFQTYNTNWATFIWNMLLSLKDKLLLDNGPVTFTFPYMKTYITVSSSDFTVPNGLLKGFISTFLTFGLIVLIYQRITALYHRLEEGNVSEVLTWSDVDDETFLM